MLSWIRTLQTWQFWLVFVIVALVLLWIIYRDSERQFVGFTPLLPEGDVNLIPAHQRGYAVVPPEVRATGPLPPGAVDVTITGTPIPPVRPIPKVSEPAQACHRNGTKSCKIHEAEVRRVLEAYYGKPFPSVRPDFLHNPSHRDHANICRYKLNKRYNLELDCYNEELGIAVEYQGYQHYTYPNRWHKSEAAYKKQLAHDQYKVQRCREMGIYFFVVPYIIGEYDLSEIEPYVVERLQQTSTIDLVD